MLIVSFFPFNLVKAYAPVSISTVAGTYNSGNLDSILTEYDADYYHVTEVVGDPAYDIRINFTEVINPFQSITLRAQYAGANNHLVCLRLWNYTSEAWDEYITLVDDTKQDEYTALVPNYQHYVCNDAVMMLICHEENGNINDDIYLDYVSLDDVSGWLEDWDARIELTLDSDDVNTSLIDFPILIHISDSSGINSTDMTAIFDVIGDDYNATAYTMGDGLTRLYFDPEYWDATEEDAYVWIAPYYVSNITDTTLFLYYDNEQDGSDYNNPKNVYDPFFVMVQHMNDFTTSTVLDSTDNDNDGTKLGANEPIEITAQIGKGQSFDGSNDRITIHGYIDADFDLTETFTLEAWFNNSVGGTNEHRILSKEWGVAEIPFTWYVVDADKHMYFYMFDGGWHGTGTTLSIVDNVFCYLAVTFSKPNMIFYVNGSTDGTKNFAFTLPTNNAQLTIGAYLTGSTYMKGMLDEIRITNGIARSPAWIGATYENQIDNFIYYSSPETVYSTDDVLQLAILAFIIALIAVALVLINSKK